MYGFDFHPDAKMELAKLNRSIQLLFSKKLKQILKNPQIGLPLGNKNSFNLAGFYKVYFNSKKHRIVYEIEEEKVVIYIIAIGKREGMEVYQKANQRRDR
ncbi:MAG: type II toxin-antitoxin system RelE/ParE family toxin [Campylobacterota bacterium]|nr:type II toxin-antitoxin system RelE/ParE family toxin [Campylobacterota bacterium]